LDIHRGQITAEWCDTETEVVRREVIRGPDRQRLRRWLEQFAGERVELAFEGCTGWRYVSEEIARCGLVAHMAEPADTQAQRGRKKRAKTDRTDAALLRRLLVEGRLPESWIPPVFVLEARSQVRLYKVLVDTRTEWLQRMHAVLFHHGVPAVEGGLSAVETRAWLMAEAELSPAGRQVLAVGYGMIDHVNAELPDLRRDLQRFAAAQPGCRALWDNHYGVGALMAVAIWAELGDCRRFSSSDQAVRHTGLDVTVHASDIKRAAGSLSRQGPPVLRWALYEAGKCAARTGAPDYQYYSAVKKRCGGNRAAMSVGRKIVRRCYHTLREMGEEALQAPSVH
jgi:transposase